MNSQACTLSHPHRGEQGGNLGLTSGPLRTYLILLPGEPGGVDGPRQEEDLRVDLTTSLDTTLNDLAAQAQQAEGETLPISVSLIDEMRVKARVLMIWAREAQNILAQIEDPDQSLKQLLDEWQSP